MIETTNYSYCWSIPIGSMYGILTWIYHENQPNVGKYTIHGSYGIENPTKTRWAGPLLQTHGISVFSLRLGHHFANGPRGPKTDWNRNHPLFGCICTYKLDTQRVMYLEFRYNCFRNLQLNIYLYTLKSWTNGPNKTDSDARKYIFYTDGTG